MLAGRGQHGLTEDQIRYCQEAWGALCGEKSRVLNVSEASRPGSKTRFNENQKEVILGADAYPGEGVNGTSQMSPLACLAHELAHWERFEIGFRRPFEEPGVFLDEAETSLHASFTSILGPFDRTCLVDDARERILEWLKYSKGNEGI